MVLFGKSGYGKSSLLRAGVIPRLTDADQPAAFRHVPIEVRFGNYAAGQSLSPLEQVKRRIQTLPTVAEPPAFLEGDHSLWGLLKARQGPEQARFVLIFDQFEEFFSYPAEEQQAFRRQLAELLYATLPGAIRDRLDSLDAEAMQAALQPVAVKALLSIRSDRLSLLDSMKDVLPAILHKRYELRPLSSEQARAAIVEPAHMPTQADGTDFASPVFEYREAALQKIITELRSELSEGIEAFQLQIVCTEIEKKVRQGQVPDRDQNGLPDVDTEDLPDFRNLYENYYRGQLSEIAAGQRLAAQRVLEDGLLATDALTGEGRRMSVDSNALIGTFGAMGLDQGLLDALERTYLIRREFNTVGGYSYEISHDTLVAPIQQAKALRQAEEERAAANRRIRRLVGIVGVVGVLLLGAGLLTAYAFQQQAEAEDAREEASLALDLANQVLDQMYFYEGKFGLTLKNVETKSYKPPKYRYGFIDRQGREVIPFTFEEATPFSNQDGYARVSREGKKYLLDTRGRSYLLAESLAELLPETEALDLHESRPDSLPDVFERYPNLAIILAYGEYGNRGKLTQPNSLPACVLSQNCRT